MTFKEFRKCLMEADSIEEHSVDSLNKLPIQFNSRGGSTQSILSFYIADGIYHIDIGEDG